MQMVKRVGAEPALFTLPAFDPADKQDTGGIPELKIEEDDGRDAGIDYWEYKSNKKQYALQR